MVIVVVVVVVVVVGFVFLMLLFFFVVTIVSNVAVVVCFDFRHTVRHVKKAASNNNHENIQESIAVSLSRPINKTRMVQYC